MTLETIIRKRKGSAGSGNAWKVESAGTRTYPNGERPAYTLWHYSTAMLTWCDTGYGVDVLHMSTGHGSVSDQNGMNKVFRTLGLNYRFNRAGGASIASPDEGCVYVSEGN